MISFEQDASYYINRAQEAEQCGDYPLALSYCRSALEKSDTVWVRFFYASFLKRRGLPHFAMRVLTPALCMIDKHSRDYAFWLKLLMDVSGSSNQFVSHIFYRRDLANWLHEHKSTPRRDPSYDLSFSSDEEKDTEGLPISNEERMALVEAIYGDDAEPATNEREEAQYAPLAFSDDKQNEEDSALCDKIMDALQKRDFGTVLELFALLHPRTPAYIKCLPYAAQAYFCTGDSTKAYDCLWELFAYGERHDIELFMFLDSNKAIDEERLDMALQIINQEDPEQLSALAAALFKRGSIDRAKEMLLLARERKPLDPSFAMQYAMLLHNVGEEDGCKEILRELVHLYSPFLPAILPNLSLEGEIIPLDFPFVPDKLVELVLAACRENCTMTSVYDGLVSKPHLVDALTFGLLHATRQSLTAPYLVNKMLADSTGRLVPYMEQILKMGPFDPEITANLVTYILTHKPKGKLYVTYNNLARDVIKHVPKGYEDYDQILRVAYGYAFILHSISHAKGIIKLMRLCECLSDFEMPEIDAFTLGYAMFQVACGKLDEMYALLVLPPFQEELLEEVVRIIRQITEM